MTPPLPMLSIICYREQKREENLEDLSELFDLQKTFLFSSQHKMNSVNECALDRR